MSDLRAGAQRVQARYRIAEGALRLAEHAVQQDRGQAWFGVLAQHHAGSLGRLDGVTGQVLGGGQRRDSPGRRRGAAGGPLRKYRTAEVDDVVGPVRCASAQSVPLSR